jgi:hypothetical protein
LTSRPSSARAVIMMTGAVKPRADSSCVNSNAWHLKVCDDAVVRYIPLTGHEVFRRCKSMAAVSQRPEKLNERRPERFVIVDDRN